MKKCVQVWKCLLTAVVMVLLCVANVMAYDVSGIVTYSGGKSGRVYVTLHGNGQYGTSIAGPGAFTIHGVQNGTYTVNAFMDVQNTGTAHATDPSGYYTTQTGPTITVSNSNFALGSSITINDPASVSQPATPSGFTVLPADNAALVMWGSSWTGVAEDADSYDLYWGTTPDSGPATTSTGSILGIPAAGDHTIVLTNQNQVSIANGSQFYFSVFANKTGQTQSVPAKTFATIGNPITSGTSVNGTVTYSGSTLPANTPTLVALVDATNGSPTQFYVGRIAATAVGNNAYTITNVPNGSYELHAIIDLNNNNIIDIGDLTSSGKVMVTVNGAPVSNANTAIIESNVVSELKTFNAGGNYAIECNINGMKKRPVTVTLTSGSGIVEQVDFGQSQSGGFYGKANIGTSAPAVGSSYLFNVLYQDLTSETISSAVTGVVTSAATLVTPSGLQPFAANQLFSWTAPSSTPSGQWYYTLFLALQGGNTWLESVAIPNSQTSGTFDALFPGHPGLLAINTPYTWAVHVNDIYGNAAANYSNFSFGTPSSLAITTTSLPNGTVGTVYSQPISYIGGTPPYTVGYTGNLPPGVPLGTDGLFSGNPTTAGTYSFTVNVTDSTSTTVSQSYTVVIGAGGSGTGTNTLVGVVVNNSNGALLSNIPVTISGPTSLTVFTDSVGNFTAQNLSDGYYTVSISAPGFAYYTYINSIYLSAGITPSLTVMLSPNQSATTYTQISGTVNYSGSKTGRIYVSLQTNSGTLGTSISGPGAFTINGVPNGSYTLTAYMDALSIGAKVLTSPAGSATANVTSSPLTGVGITLVDSTVTTPKAPANISVAPADSLVLIGWDRAKDANGVEQAEAYDIYWGTSALLTKATATGSKAGISAGLDSPVIIDGLTNGTSLYFMIIPKVGTTEGAASAVAGPFTVGALVGGNTVSGTVNFSGATPAGTLYVAVVEPKSKGMGKIFLSKIANPTASQAFTIAGVANGTYAVYALFDLNNDKMFAIGDVNNTSGDTAPIVTLNNSSATGIVISLAAKNAEVAVTTEHGVSSTGGSDWYNVNGIIRGQLKRPVKVTLTNVPAASGISVPVDLGIRGGDKEIDFWSNVPVRPVVGDTYTFSLTYADNSTESLSASVTGVIDSFPTSPAISGAPVSTIPTFTWSAPSTPPANYHYSMWVGGNNGNTWDNWFIPGNQLSAVYGSDGQASPLILNNTYNWNISVMDQFGNRASVSSNFTPTVASVSISGSVKNAGGAPVLGATINAYSSTNSSVVLATASSDASGNYQLTNLTTGSYKLAISALGYLSQLYSGKSYAGTFFQSSTFAVANPVLVTAGTVTNGVNVVMSLGSTISGIVSNSSGVGISNVYVSAYDPSTNTYLSNSVYTDINGLYTLIGIPVGSYKVGFSPSSGGYVSQVYNNKPYSGSLSTSIADLVVVTEASATTINVTLAMGGTISGTVTNAATGTGQPSAAVSVYDAVSGSFITSGSTDTTGAYTVTGIPAGNVKLFFSALGYIPQWYNNKGTNIASADLVNVVAASTTSGINAALQVGGNITGTVTNSSGTPLSGITVTAFDASNIQVANGSTNASGLYTIPGLPTGNYKVRFNATNSSNNYVAVWNTNKPSITTADSISVTVGTTTSGINASLATGYSISGTVISGGVSVAANVNVVAYNTLDETVATATTSTSGTYSIKGLPSGSYKLKLSEVVTNGTAADGYVSKVYTNPDVNTVHLSQGTVIPISSTSVTGINVILAKDTGSISGTITDALTSVPVAGVTARVTDLNGALLSFGSSDASGNYIVKGLPTGTYKVEFVAPAKYAQQWYSVKGDYSSATTVSVTSSSTTSSINAAMVTGPGVFLTTVVKGYGNVNVGTASVRTLQVNNSGTADLTLGSLSMTGADFTLVNDLCSGKTLLPSNGYCTIQVSFTPSSGGAKSATVNIPSNDPETAITSILVKGTGVSSDVVAPTILTITPANNATNVSINAVLTVKFSEAIDQTTLPVETTFIKTNAGTYIPGVGTYDTATNTGTFTPLTPLAYNTTYTGTLSGIKDLAGNVMVSSYTFTFTTGANPDSTGPSVVSSTPKNNATNVAVDGALTVTFSEPVKPATVQGALVLRVGNTSVAGTVTFDSSTNTATFTPATPLSMGTTYSLTVGSTIEDLASNKLIPATIFFATEVPTGDIDGLNGVDIADAYKMLEIAVGNVTASAQDLKRADVAPLINGKPKPDGVIDVADVVVILRRIVGLVNW